MGKVKSEWYEGFSKEQLDEWVAEAEAGYDPAKMIPVDPKTLEPVDLRGRPSLSGNGHSPKLQVRLDTQLNEALRERAKQEDRSVSDLVREILREAVGPRR